MNLADACRTELDADTATAQAALDRAIATGVPPRTPNPDGTPSSYDLAFEPEHVLAVLGAMRRILDEVCRRSSHWNVSPMRVRWPGTAIR